MEAVLDFLVKKNEIPIAQHSGDQTRLPTDSLVRLYFDNVSKCF